MENQQLVKECGCGQSVSEENFAVKKEYSLWGWFCLGMGITTYPQSVQLRCPKCEQKLHELKDPQEIKNFLNRQGHL